jgi:hypothetical protein
MPLACANLDAETIGWRAVRGKTARTVRMEGSESFPTHIIHYLIICIIKTATLAKKILTHLSWERGRQSCRRFLGCDSQAL